MKNDRDLQENVLRALEYEPGIDAAKIGVSVASGIVTLQGTVPSYYQKLAAARVTQHVFGVKAVANDVSVVPEGTLHRTDADIAQSSVAALMNTTTVPMDTVQVSVSNGWITLAGDVHWHYERAAAEQAVQHLYGVRGVINNLVIRPAVSVSDVRSKIEGAFRRSAEVDSTHVHVTARDHGVTLTGSVRSLSELRAAEHAAWSAPGVTLVDNRLVVVP